MQGWIKLYRSIAAKAYYKKDSERVHLWIHLLISAAHTGKEEMFGGKPVFCKPGQFTTGRKQLAEETGINESKIERILTYFEKTEQQIEQQKSNVNRLITITNWAEFQLSEQESGQQPNNERTTTEQQVNTPKECIECNNDKNVNNESLQSNDCPPEEKVVVEEKPKKKSTRKKKTEPSDKDTQLNSEARKIFEARYLRETREKYYWTGKDGGNMTNILNALKHQRTEKGLSNENNTDILAALSMFINIAVKDEWIKKKLSVSILFSQFNEIVARAKAEEQERKSAGNYGVK